MLRKIKNYSDGLIQKKDLKFALYTKEKIYLHNLFFDRLISEFDLKKVNGNIIAVLHILPDAIPFIRALSKIANIKAIIPKPKSINRDVLTALNHLPIYHFNRGDSFYAISKLDKKSVFMDIGGYFCKFSKNIKIKYRDNFAGVVEDTENGLQKYLKEGITFPFFSVARSPLKYNEDVMVGQAITFSAETILRKYGIVINGLDIGIIGYGKIGASIAKSFEQKQGKVSVFDIDNIRLTHAVSFGFNITNKDNILAQSDVLCLATGNLSLIGDDYKKLKHGAWIFSVTSSDDEIDTKWVEANYEKEKISCHVTKYFKGEHYFYILNDGNAINFIHGTTVGDFILLTHAELIISAYALLTGNIKDSHEIDTKTRDKICKIWLDIFKRDENNVKLLKNQKNLHKSIIKSLREYANRYPNENIKFLLNYIEETSNSTKRSNMPGHFTASGIIIKNNEILLIFHNRLQKFLQPGGHIENDFSLCEAAKREVFEETGLRVKNHPLYGDSPIHIDIHKIPANDKKGEPEHFHYDCIFVFFLNNNNVKLQEEEVSRYQWVSLDYKFKDAGIKEVVKKIKKDVRFVSTVKILKK